jgi:hypothetical protein
MIASQGITSTAEMTAMCGIRKGAEIFTTYLGEQKLMARKEIRQRMLMP